MLFELNRDNPSKSARIAIKQAGELQIKEKVIEDFLVANLMELLPEEQLMILGQERSWQEEADILALDRNGVLYIFELKRWQSSSENLLQVLRYGQKFGRFSYEKLQTQARRMGDKDIVLQLAHQRHFDLKEPLAEEAFNVEQRFVVVTNGVDEDTLEAIQYWYEKGIKIESLTYKLYEIGGNAFLQFETFNPEKQLILETNPGTFIVNTNSTYMSDAWKDMLNDGKTGKASAYYDKKGAVRKITKGSTVFLYHNGRGVVACGKAQSEYQSCDYDGNKDAEYFVPLKFDWALPNQEEWNAKAVKAWEINGKTGASNRFRQTVFNASAEMAKAIQDLWHEKAKTQ